MSIKVTCPNGHAFKVKDKYAGKQGLCPFCEDPVVVSVPDALSEEAILDIIGPPPPIPVTEESASVLDDDVESESALDDSEDVSATMSLVGRSAVRHQRECPSCSRTMPYWFAKCPGCDTYMQE